MYAQSWPTLCDSMGYSPPVSSVHGISQARMLEWVAISYSRGTSQPRDQTHVSCISWIGRQILYHCSPWEDTPPTPKQKWRGQSRILCQRFIKFPPVSTCCPAPHPLTQQRVGLLLAPPTGFTSSARLWFHNPFKSAFNVFFNLHSFFLSLLYLASFFDA